MISLMARMPAANTSPPRTNVRYWPTRVSMAGGSGELHELGLIGLAHRRARRNARFAAWSCGARGFGIERGRLAARPGAHLEERHGLLQLLGLPAHFFRRGSQLLG